MTTFTITRTSLTCYAPSAVGVRVGGVEIGTVVDALGVEVTARFEDGVVREAYALLPDGLWLPVVCDGYVYTSLGNRF
jgi:hypothetical protein